MLKYFMIYVVLCFRYYAKGASKYVDQLEENSKYRILNKEMANQANNRSAEERLNNA